MKYAVVVNEFDPSGEYSRTYVDYHGFETRTGAAEYILNDLDANIHDCGDGHFIDVDAGKSFEIVPLAFLNQECIRGGALEELKGEHDSELDRRLLLDLCIELDRLNEELKELKREKREN